MRAAAYEMDGSSFHSGRHADRRGVTGMLSESGKA